LIPHYYTVNIQILSVFIQERKLWHT